MANPFDDEPFDDDLLHDGTAERRSLLVLDTRSAPIGIDDDSDDEDYSNPFIFHVPKTSAVETNAKVDIGSTLHLSEDSNPFALESTPSPKEIASSDAPSGRRIPGLLKPVPSSPSAQPVAATPTPPAKKPLPEPKPLPTPKKSVSTPSSQDPKNRTMSSSAEKEGEKERPTPPAKPPPVSPRSSPGSLSEGNTEERKPVKPLPTPIDDVRTRPKGTASASKPSPALQNARVTMEEKEKEKEKEKEPAKEEGEGNEAGKKFKGLMSDLKSGFKSGTKGLLKLTKNSTERTNENGEAKESTEFTVEDEPEEQATGPKVLNVAVCGLEIGRYAVEALVLPIAASRRLVVPTSKPAPTYRSTTVEVVGCQDSNEFLLGECKQMSANLYTTDSFPDIVAHSEIDIVAIYTLDQDQRFNQLLLALKQGKNVLIEHPMVTTLREAQLVVSLTTNGAFKGDLQVVQISQVFPSFIQQHKAYKSGEIGEVEALEVSLVDAAPWSFDSPFNHMRIISALSSAVTLLRCFMRNIETLSAFGRISNSARRAGLNFFDIYTVNAMTKSGQIGRIFIHLSEERPVKPSAQLSCVLHGTKATSTASYPDMVYASRGDSSEKADVIQMLDADHNEFYFNREKNPKACYGGIANYLNHFADSINSGSANIKNSVSQGLQTFMLVEAIQRSAKTRQVVSLKDLKAEIWGENSPKESI